ncbi:hypothetical protein F4803DRAFT_527801 [Xylaria telfairii]|nr:hypothetical protein F4803DRAFT_527801 [Xylaria telfairii]
MSESMAGTPDFDFQYDVLDPLMDPQEATFNDIFADVNFDQDVGSGFGDGFEDRLAEDFPIKQEPPPTPPPCPDASVLDPESTTNGACVQQQQFVNPQHISNDFQPTYTSPDLIGADWPLSQKDLDRILGQDLEAMLAQDPIFDSQSLQTQMYPDYCPMGNQVNVQPTIYQQPVVTQIHGQQTLHHQPTGPGYTWPVTYEPFSQVISPPMAQQMAQHMLQPIPQPIPQQIPQLGPVLPLMPQPQPPGMPPPMPQPRAPGMPPPMPQPRAPGMPPPMPQPRVPGMPPPPNVPTSLIPSRPFPQRPMPKGDHKPVNASADSFVPVHLRSSRNSRELPSAGTRTTSPPIKRPAKNHNGEALLNDRIPRKTHQKKGPQDVEPELYYGPSPPKPRDWGPRNARGKFLFTYTEKGELSAGLFLTAREMRLYLLGPSPQDDLANFEGPFRLPGVKLRTKKRRQGLTLWVGWPAAMSNARYPRGGESTKCRFKNCPYGQRTIALGDPWVIFDERQNVEGEAIDPFHNAGYVHLFCLESNFDLVDLWQCLDIRPDYRVFKRESHPYFCLAYKLPGVDAIVKEWWFSAFRDWEVARSHGMKRVRVHESSLTQRLVTHKLENEPKAQMASREKRGGADLAKHRGDPEMKERLVAFRRNGLLDERGWPVPGADELLNQIEIAKRRRRRGSISEAPDYLPSPLPVDGYGQQLHYPGQHIKVEDPVHDRKPVYNSPQPIHPTANLVHLNRPMMPAPYPPEAPNAPAAMGQKRNWDEATLAPLRGFNGMPSEAPPTSNPESPFQKRRRIDGIAPAYPQPTARTLPTPTPPNVSVAAGHAEIKTEDGLPQYDLEDDKLNAWPPLIDHSVNSGLHGVDETLGVDDLDALFDDPVTEMVLDDGKLTNATDDHIVGSETAQAEPAPTLPHEARANQSDSDSDSLDNLFGDPSSSPSGSPKAGGPPSPVKAESPLVTTKIKTEPAS